MSTRYSRRPNVTLNGPSDCSDQFAILADAIALPELRKTTHGEGHVRLAPDGHVRLVAGNVVRAIPYIHFHRPELLTVPRPAKPPSPVPFARFILAAEGNSGGAR
jgi:hypothetical protein